MKKIPPRHRLFVHEYLVDAERFWSYVDLAGGPSACWPWKGARDPNGYGRFHVGKSWNSAMLAHRVALGLTTGESPEAVCHKCDNPSCCNPSHLFAGTRTINNADMVEKGRHWAKGNPECAAKGEDHGSAKLTNAQVKSIRTEYETSGASQRKLAGEFGVCQRTINKVVRRIGWAHV